MTNPPFTKHAKDQIRLRYDIEFADEQWWAFGERLNDPMTIRLSNSTKVPTDYFVASHFIGHWYLLLLARDGTVITAYPRKDISPEDKQTLRLNEHYCRINNDEFGIFGSRPSRPTRSYCHGKTDKEWGTRICIPR